MPQHLKQASRARKPFIIKPRLGSQFRWLLILAALLTLTPGVAPASLAAPTSTIAGEKLVLAFYYMWYGPDSFSQGRTAGMPRAPYISDKADVVERQVKEAKGAGIDAFISSWTGNGTETDRNFPLLLDAAARNNFRATIYFETNSAMQKGDVVSQLRSVMERFGSHPAFLRWNGKPVVFFWRPDALGDAATWRSVRQKVDPANSQLWSVDTVDGAYLDAFDTIHFFSAGKWDANTDVARVQNQWRAKVDAYNKQHGTQRLWTGGVTPGWDDSKSVQPNTPIKVIPRKDGALYEENWRAAIAANPEWITITSWNEWFEGSQIEPAADYGNRYLDITRQYSALFKVGPSPCDGGTPFRETGHAICKAMESYWRQFGGLAQFGYPISAPAVERSAIDGKDYTVQYFERARFELHPEQKGTPYEVQLSLLGRQFHAVDPPVGRNNKPGHHYFPETGHNVSPAFYKYWQEHGGLFVNGYPITEEIQERLSDGKTYTVQYFERVRMELHPENPAPNNVLLGLLGRTALEQKHGR
ncbi:MAG TPA: endo-1,3-alpha-glucanase family glycosylhydrolase [Chloroflexia bacterium]|nr:endo-1,3-alpha-glucanase family glycosylhydrolase [Chloroflexia bacterium]